MRISDWSSDVCSSDLRGDFLVAGLDVERFETLRLRQHLRFEAADEGVICSRSLVDFLADARDVRTHPRHPRLHLLPVLRDFRAEERRVWNTCVSPCSTRWSPYN